MSRAGPPYRGAAVEGEPAGLIQASRWTQPRDGTRMRQVVDGVDVVAQEYGVGGIQPDLVAGRCQLFHLSVVWHYSARHTPQTSPLRIPSSRSRSTALNSGRSRLRRSGPVSCTRSRIASRVRNPS